MLVRILVSISLHHSARGQHSKLMMSHIVMTRTRWLLHLLLMLVLSSVGSALSLACLWAYKERLILIMGESNAQFFYYFSLVSLLISGLAFVGSFILISVQCSELSLDQAETGPLRRTTGTNQRRAYGAFGYYSII